MPLKKSTAEEVYARLSGNKNRIYPSEARGKDRLFPFARPAITPGFRFGKDSSVFATGSCFARNIEKSLSFIGADVVSSPLDIPVPVEGKNVFQLYNKYTVHSILNELRWALADAPVDHGASLVAGKDGRFADLQVTSAADMVGTKEEMTAFRTAYNASFARARDADVVIVTLGLVECWFDTETGLYLNMAPKRAMIDHYPGRFEFHVLDYADILEALTEIDDLLRAGNATPPKLLVTVSPVGLASTFRENDVLTANCYSKSVQRAAVEAFVASTDADYFPSYEYVTLTDRQFAWSNKDFRHVRQETVDRIMADVLLHYVGPSPEQELLYLRGHSQAYFDANDFDRVIEMLEPAMDRFGDEPDLMWIYARTLNKLKRREECIAVCESLMQSDHQYARSAGRTAVNVARMVGADDKVDELERRYLSLFPTDVDFPNRAA